MRNIDKIINLIPFTIMCCIGLLTFINQTNWWSENSLTISCMIGYSLIFCIWGLYMSMKYIKKLVVEIPLICLSLSSLTMAILQPKTVEDIEIVYLWDMGYMCLMISTFILIIYFRLAEKLKRDFF